MTISTTTTTITHLGNGATTVFSFPFVGVSASDLDVTYVDTLGNSVLLSPSLYTVTINAIPFGGLWGIGGSVTYPNTGSPPVPIQVGTSLTITRSVPYTQDTSISNQGAFYPQAVERGLDELELQIQQVHTDYDYTLKFPVTDGTPPNTLPVASVRADGFLAFDGNGQPIISTTPSVIPEPGAYATPRRIITTGTASLNILSSDSFNGVSIYQSSSPVTTLQLPTDEGPYPVFDGNMNFGTYPVTILPPVGKTIQGFSSFVMAFSGMSVSFYNDGAQIIVL